VESKPEDYSPKLNRNAGLSFWAGIASLVPYLYGGVIFYLLITYDKILQNEILNRVISVIFMVSIVISAPLYIVGGIFFGLMSLINGILAIQHLNLDKETGYRLAVIGMMLGMLGIMGNILLWYVFIRAIISDL
jgi:hypothetical protein